MFSRDEIELLKQSIAILDQANKLNLQSLPTIRKIMEEIQLVIIKVISMPLKGSRVLLLCSTFRDSLLLM